jgi:hypothetical protein
MAASRRLYRPFRAGLGQSQNPWALPKADLLGPVGANHSGTNQASIIFPRSAGQYEVFDTPALARSVGFSLLEKLIQQVTSFHVLWIEINH